MTTERHAGVLILAAAAILAGGGCTGKDDDGTVPRALTASEIRELELVAENNRGVATMGRFEFGAAHEIFRRLVETHPDHPELKTNLAIATFNRQRGGDESAGLSLLEEVLELDPSNLRAHYCAGMLMLRNGRTNEAETHFRMVVEADPDDAYAAYSLARSIDPDHPEEALAWYERALERDPYLRSAYSRVFQMLQRLGRSDEAPPYIEAYRRMEKNPRARLLEGKYTRMGPKAEAITFDAGFDAERGPPPRGPAFAAGRPLTSLPAGLAWGFDGDAPAPSVTACDIDGSGTLDLLLTNVLDWRDGAPNAVLLGDGAGGFAVDIDHPLARIPLVNAPLWGDFDNDGRTDVYLCRRGANRLMRQDESGVYTDVTDTTETGGGDLDTVDGAMLDADHDGDLDLFCVNADGPNELLSNDLDGTFRPIAQAQGIAGDGRPSRQVVPVDLDGDRDLDLIVVNASPPHEVYRNDRLWRYEPMDDLAPLARAPVEALAAADRDADGSVELYLTTGDGSLAVVEQDDASDAWSWRALPSPVGLAGGRLVAMDVTGNGIAELVSSHRAGWVVLEPGRSDPVFVAPGQPIPTWAPVVLDPGRGPSIVSVEPGAAPERWAPGPGRGGFTAITLGGRTDEAASMRSNASGIGARVASRRGSTWIVDTTLPTDASPGQSLQPLAVGLGSASGLDFVALDWSDGVCQSEIDVEAGGPHHITETQR